MNNLSNKTDEAVSKFFATCNSDPEMDFNEFVEAVSIALGSSIGLQAEGMNVPLLLDKANEGMRAGASLSRQMKPIADIIRTGVMPGVIVVSVSRQK